jgi:hypothetical protein
MPPPPPFGGPPVRPASAAAAQTWGAVSLLFGALVLFGSMTPWFAESTFSVTDDMSSAWPLLVIGLVGVVGGIDGLRGSLLGPATAAGIGSVFVLVQVVLLRFLSEVPEGGMGSGGIAWTLAAVVALVLVVAVLSLLLVDRAQSPAEGWLGAVSLVAGAVWVAGMVLPATPGVSLGDHVEYVLLGGDSFSDVLTGAFIGVPVALVLLAAMTRSRAAHGLAAGSMTYWTLATVTAAAGYGASGNGTVRYTYFGRFWPMLLGALGVAITGCVAMLVARPRPVTALLPAVGVALLPIAGIVGAVEYSDGQDQFGPGQTYGTPEVYEDEVFEEADVTGDEGDVRGSFDVVCTGLVDSTIRSAWQDVDGAIHVVVLVNNDCEIGQRLADPSASFTLTAGNATVADATFDFSSRPVAVPAYGSTEAEIVFGPGTFVDLAAIETLGLGTDTAVGSGSFGLTYSYRCTDAPGTTAPSAGAEVAGEPTDSPVVPRTTTEGDALARLAEIVRADAPFIGTDVTDRWVPQISSKKPDVTLPNGTVWSAQSILEDHRSWRQRFPRVRLLWSGDYSTFEQTDFWVTIVAVPFDTAESALAWCTTQALPHEDCYAKLISHTHPHDGSTRLR